MTLWRDGQHHEADLWPARDAVVMKALAGLHQDTLPISPHVAHITGNGGQKGAVRLARHVADQRVMRLLVQYVWRTAERGGLYWEHRRGIALGCPLSPVIGAFYLAELDEALERLGFFWVRFQDDILVLTPTRWKLRKAVKVLTQALGGLRLAKHPDKTFIGRIEKGFDWLGHELWPGRLRVARKTWARFLARVRQLYERGADASHIDAYRRQWVGWVIGGHHACAISTDRPRLPFFAMAMANFDNFSWRAVHHDRAILVDMAYYALAVSCVTVDRHPDSIRCFAQVDEH